MSDVALRVRNIDKIYRIGVRQGRPSTLRERLSGFAANRARAREARAERNRDSRISALRNVSFDVTEGEVVGIIGPNGAGKSTLLKILSRVTEPTAGYAEIYGRVTSLLDVGIGFHPELTGRENVYLNGAIMGMKRAEINARLDDIVSFAEVEKFLDTPVKRYSTGMYMRLAFSVAAHLEPEILIVDEVLAVGDMHFQRKCLGKMESVAKGGRTVLFVSHNMEMIQRLCTRGFLLQSGCLVAEGPISEVVSRYRDADSAVRSNGFDAQSRRGEGWAQVADLRLVNERGLPVSAIACDADLCFEVDLRLRDETVAQTLRGLVLELTICSSQGRPLLSLMSVDDDGVDLPATRECRLRIRLAGPTLVPGRYYINAFLGLPGRQWVDWIRDAFVFEVLPPDRPWRPYEIDSAGVFCRKADWACLEPAAVGVPPFGDLDRR